MQAKCPLILFSAFDELQYNIFSVYLLAQYARIVQKLGFPATFKVVLPTT